MCNIETDFAIYLYGTCCSRRSGGGRTRTDIVRLQTTGDHKHCHSTQRVHRACLLSHNATRANELLFHFRNGARTHMRDLSALLAHGAIVQV